MILRFLRWFPQYRTLETQLQRECSGKHIALAEKADLEERLREEFEGRTRALKAQNEAQATCKEALEREEALSNQVAIGRRQLEAEGRAKIEAQDRVRELEATVTQIKGEAAEANAKVAQSSMLVADFLSQQMFGKPIYGVAPALPEGSQTVEPINRSRVQARAAADEMTAEFMRQYDELQPQ